jgi:transcriptional regulator with XRE-family HTH domain
VRRSRDLPRSVGHRIADLRSSLGLTQEQLADRLGIAVKNLQRIESGQNLTLRSVERISMALGLEVIELFAAPLPRPRVRRSAGSAIEGLTSTAAVLIENGEDAPPNAVPVTTLRAAAGRLGEAREVEALAWAVLPGRRPPQGSFLARIVGRSMEPRLPDGAWALFRAPALPPLRGRVVLLARGVDDRQHEAFLLKKIASSRAGSKESLLVTLASFNPAFPPVEVVVREERDLRAVADFVRLIAEAPGPRGSGPARARR